MSTCFLYTVYREHFYFVGRFHGSAFHGDRFTAGSEAHTNLTDKSASLTADNSHNKVVIIHSSQEVLKIVPLYT
jgi:predicted NAD/FAD-binding protein